MHSSHAIITFVWTILGAAACSLLREFVRVQEATNAVEQNPPGEADGHHGDIDLSIYSDGACVSSSDAFQFLLAKPFWVVMMFQDNQHAQQE